MNSLPTELVDALNQTYFLHLLATNPAKVVPPGKSVLSMITQPDVPHVLDQVAQVARRAFWDEATETISSPLPSVQIPRLRRLYLDLHDALSSLFPPRHDILVSLSAPLPPTSSPLLSTIALLQDLLLALRYRCAPVRDPEIDQLLSSLLDPPQSNILAPAQPTSPLADLVVSTMRSTLSLVDLLKSDLTTFTLGSMTESQLQKVLLDDVKTRERDLVLKVWGGPDVIRNAWRSWLADSPDVHVATVPDDRKWLFRLFKALDSNHPVFSELPASPSTGDVHNTAENAQVPNSIPPQLFFTAPALEYAQNYIQAITIAAALRLLARLPPVPTRSDDDPSSSDFMHRLWTLLKSEIDDDLLQLRVPDSHTMDTSPTKIVNLADEVVRARQSSQKLDQDEENRIRADVERTLRATDPVFLLLKKRLLTALEKRLILDSPIQNGIPVKMQTGRNIHEERAGKRPRLMDPSSSTQNDVAPPTPVGYKIPGFEGTLLQQAIGDVEKKLRECINWTVNVWGDLV